MTTHEICFFDVKFVADVAAVNLFCHTQTCVTVLADVLLAGIAVSKVMLIVIGGMNHTYTTS